MNFRVDFTPCFFRLRQFCSTSQNVRSLPLPEQLDQIRYDTGPPGLMTRPDAGTVVAMKVLVEQDVVPPMRVRLEFFGAAVNRPAAVGIARESSGQPTRDLLGHFEQVHQFAGTGRAFDPEIVTIVLI